MRNAILAAALLVAACGSNYSTAGELRDDLGEPCTVEEESGSEVWTYCAQECAEGWCLGTCSAGCMPRWRMRIVNGIIVDTLEKP